ncbi:hypothetical protein PDIG_38030 [Penicillium digitatum PHI26]|uniref:Uncharacterized protein n=2 Tax=Penicillium digitatum TaxID=36651 RepID=K9FWW3_PEND2|nr:hypothetical protein PDIP_84610 [Penicillium digitatum Pd1]EKV05099.1 hypothetical protein PDIP_84610 [Penicillium digitatum Pd1]EKV13614.1 hypothetical protein PDIG_38030 [Penicillium digitatum PHI26]
MSCVCAKDIYILKCKEGKVCQEAMPMSRS